MGDADSAIDSFRRATVKNRTEKRYVLALAGALALTHQDEPARNALLAVREALEDPDVNLELARLADDGQDFSSAVREYHNALYAPWPPHRAQARRHVRIELIDRVEREVAKSWLAQERVSAFKMRNSGTTRRTRWHPWRVIQYTRIPISRSTSSSIASRRARVCCRS
jgi:hypothetical protein